MRKPKPDFFSGIYWGDSVAFTVFSLLNICNPQKFEVWPLAK